VAERFYAAGEERAQMRLPEGYGYRSRARDNWVMSYMVMNHRSQVDTAYIQYTVTFDDSPNLIEADPYWLDVRDCLSDPVYDVPGGGARGSLHTRQVSWRPPVGGRIVAGGGHMHGGGKELRLSQPGCGDRTLARSKPKWGLASHPFYNVRPVLHEPGPIGMSSYTTRTGIPVAAGEEVRLSSIYDAERPHTRVMGINIVYFAADPAVTEACGRLPSDLETVNTDAPGRTVTPRVTVPLTGLDARGRARTIARPPGRTVRVRGAKASVGVRDLSFSTPNLSVARGTTVQWRFGGPSLHDVTLASGPRGFSSPHLDDGRVFRSKLETPGTYKLFCSLHPVAMTQRVIVR
jgi:plastocyanin